MDKIYCVKCRHKGYTEKDFEEEPNEEGIMLCNESHTKGLICFVEFLYLDKKR